MGTRPPDQCKVPPVFWRSMTQAGLPPEVLLRQARLPATLHLNKEVVIPTSQFFALWKAIEVLMPEPGLGVRLIEALNTASHPPSTLAAFHASDFRDALERLARFKHLCTPEILQWEDHKGECNVRVIWLYASEPAPAITADICFATLMEVGRRGTGQRLAPSRVELVRPDPKTRVYQDYFGCPVRFGAAADLLVLKSQDLDRNFPHHNPELLEMLTPPLSAAMEELETPASFSEQVRSALKRSLASGRPELGKIARDLRLSERTLQRRITEEGKTFRDLLTEARQELGRQLLATPDMSINEVAYLLGYQDTNAFHRAFREWEGVTPAQWRASNTE